jgi:hypothetical protein
MPKAISTQNWKWRHCSRPIGRSRQPQDKSGSFGRYYRLEVCLGGEPSDPARA